MDNINKFLERFKKITIPGESVRIKTAEILSAEFGEEIKIEDISIKINILFIKTSDASLKSEVFLKKNKILGKLREFIGKDTPKAIR